MGRNRVGWIRWSVLGALLAAGGVRVAGWQGLWRPVYISGGSMAETLTGEHFAIACRECRFPIRYDAAAPPRGRRVVCPNCGQVNDHPADEPIRAGRRVLVDRLVYRLRKPARWDVAAFHTPGDESWLSVKRIVGLPGERVEFRQGDLVVDGRLVQKSLDQLRTLAVLVHNDAYPPGKDADLPARWQSEPAACGWHAGDRGYRFHPGGENSFARGWLVYQHWPCYAGIEPRTQPSPILDNYGYNQRLSRRLNAVSDVMLSSRVRTPGRSGWLAFQVLDGDVRYSVELRFDQRELALVRGTQSLKRLALPYAAFARGVELELALCDGQVLFGIDRQEVFREPISPQPVARPAGDSAGPRLAIGAAGLAVTVDRLRVLRDLYYLPPTVSTSLAPELAALGADEVYVVGDNVPISRDSRHWPRPGVPIGNLLGRVHAGTTGELVPPSRAAE